MSQPAWAAWIEINWGNFTDVRLLVAARMGCVDLNALPDVAVVSGFRRSPHGLRGLKDNGGGWRQSNSSQTLQETHTSIGQFESSVISYGSQRQK